MSPHRLALLVLAWSVAVAWRVAAMWEHQQTYITKGKAEYDRQG